MARTVTLGCAASVEDWDPGLDLDLSRPPPNVVWAPLPNLPSLRAAANSLGYAISVSVCYYNSCYSLT